MQAPNVFEENRLNPTLTHNPTHKIMKKIKIMSRIKIKKEIANAMCLAEGASAIKMTKVTLDRQNFIN